jgi:hypothetical protein
MPTNRAKLKLATTSTVALAALPQGGVETGIVLNVGGADGLIEVLCADGCPRACAWLENGENQHVRLTVGDTVLLVAGTAKSAPIVMGRIGRYSHKPPGNLKLEAVDTITLACGESSIALRADGKVTIRGEDVLVRAKGTQRIRAGTVSIN